MQSSTNVFRRFAVDLAKMKEFYGDVLGLQAAADDQHAGRRQMTRFHVGTSEIKLQPSAGGEPGADPAACRTSIGLRVLTFFFPDEAALTGRFKEHGMPAPEFTERAARRPARRWSSDPSGQWVELVVVPGAPAATFEQLEVGLTVTDLEKSRAFYREFVGLEELKPVADAILGVTKYPFRLGTTTINVWSFGKGAAREQEQRRHPVRRRERRRDRRARERTSASRSIGRSAPSARVFERCGSSDPDGITNYFAQVAGRRPANGTGMSHASGQAGGQWPDVEGDRRCADTDDTSRARLWRRRDRRRGRWPGRAADKNRDWPAYAGDKASTKYSPLDQINKDTVKNLKIAWRQSGVPEELQATCSRRAGAGQLPAHAAHGRRPALHEHRASAPSPRSIRRPARPSGSTRCRHDPTARARRAAARRAASPTGPTAATRASSRTSAPNLVALNAKTGKRYPDFGDERPGRSHEGLRAADHRLALEQRPDRRARTSIVVGGVPAPATDILNERAKAPKEMPPDDVRGYDVRTGKLLWTFHVVPRKGEFGNDTWLNDSWTYSGNSGVWSLLSADEELGYVYLPFEEATGDYYGGTRPGNNLFAESIVCLDAKTGKRVWHFQTLHHGLWDYDLPAAPDPRRHHASTAARIKALAQVSKQAYVYVLDRVTGKPVWPIEERPVPQGERARRVVFADAADSDEAAGVRSAGRRRTRICIDFTPELKAEALKIVNEYKYGPLYTPPVLLGTPKGQKGTILVPGTNGGADWGGAAFDPGNRHPLRAVGAHAGHHRRSASRSIPSRRCPA